MPNPIRRYARWLHTRWPAGTVEKLPEVGPDGSTRVPGVFVVGDLTGIPLLKNALHTGSLAVQRIALELGATRTSRPAGTSSLEGAAAPAEPYDLLVIGAGVSGMAAAMEANRSGLTFAVLESAEPFVTVANFPKRKPIFTYPTGMKPAGSLQVTADVKEPLLQELRDQASAAGIGVLRGHATRIVRERGGTLAVHRAEGDPIRALRVLIAIGKSGDYRRLGIPGEERDKVTNRLHDPKDFRGQRALVVGGGDSAVETALLLDGAGAQVTLVHRGAELSRPKPEHVEQLRRSGVELRLTTRVREIGSAVAWNGSRTTPSSP
jgi:NosR/NirI family transcriptional regulator, nitrous oxide reductase regulator